MLCLVRYVAAKIPAHNAVPGGVVFLVKFLEEVDGRRRKVINMPRIRTGFFARMGKKAPKSSRTYIRTSNMLLHVVMNALFSLVQQLEKAGWWELDQVPVVPVDQV